MPPETNTDTKTQTYEELFAQEVAESEKGLDTGEDDLQSDVDDSSTVVAKDTDDTPAKDGDTGEDDPDKTVNWETRYKEVQGWATSVHQENLEIKKTSGELREQLAAIQERLGLKVSTEGSDEVAPPPSYDQLMDGLSDEDKEVLKDSPALGKLVEKLVAVQEARFQKVSQREIQQAVQNMIAQQSQTSQAEQEMASAAKVRTEIPDFETRVNDPRFQDWKNSNQAQINAILTKHPTDTVAAAKAVFSLYDNITSFLSNTGDRTKRRISGMQAPPKGGSTRQTAVPEDFQGAFEFYEKHGSV